MVENLNTHPIALQKIKIGNTNWPSLFDSVSSCTILNMSLAKEIKFNCMQAQWSEKIMEISDMIIGPESLFTVYCCSFIGHLKI